MHNHSGPEWTHGECMVTGQVCHGGSRESNARLKEQENIQPNLASGSGCRKEGINKREGDPCSENTI